MKKMIYSFAFIALLVVGLFAITGCGKKGLVDSWETSGYTYTFNEDKTGSYSYGSTKMAFTYEDDGKTVSILYTGNTIASSYEYKIDGDKLIIKDSFGSDVIYTRK